MGMNEGLGMREALGYDGRDKILGSGSPKITKQVQIMDAMEILKSKVTALELLRDKIHGKLKEIEPKNETDAPRNIPPIAQYLEGLPLELQEITKWIDEIRISIHEGLY